MYLTYDWVFVGTDSVAARDSVVLLRNTAGLYMSVGSWLWMYAGNLEDVCQSQ